MAIMCLLHKLSLYIVVCNIDHSTCWTLKRLLVRECRFAEVSKCRLCRTENSLIAGNGLVWPPGEQHRSSLRSTLRRCRQNTGGLSACIRKFVKVRVFAREMNKGVPLVFTHPSQFKLDLFQKARNLVWVSHQICLFFVRPCNCWLPEVVLVAEEGGKGG